MRLPSHLLAKLTLAGLAVGCEPAHQPACETAPTVEEGPPPPHLDDVVRMTNERMPVRPAVAPRFVQPQQVQPQPQPSRPTPQPVIKKKPKRKVFASICGHAPQLVDENASLVRCGKG